jgi:hypothetical protein
MDRDPPEWTAADYKAALAREFGAFSPQSPTAGEL